MLIFDSYVRLHLLVAILPSVFLMIYIYKKDRIEKEPIVFLIKVLLYGAFSCIWVSIAEYLAIKANDFIFTKDYKYYVIIEAFLCVGLIEEYFKYRALKKATWESPNFDCRFDAVVYAVFASLGFATVENIIYVFKYGISTGLIRAIVSVPGHMMFGVCMGIHYGQAKFHFIHRDIVKTKRELRRAVFYPTILHGFFDYCLMTGTTKSTVMFYVFLVLLYVISYIRIKKYSDNDFYFYPQYLFNDDDF